MTGGWAQAQSKWHWFESESATKSICGIGYAGQQLIAGNDDSPDNCRDCRKRLAGRRKNEVKARKEKQ